MANVVQDLKAKLMIAAAELASGSLIGKSSLVVDPGITDPNVRNLDIEAGEKFKIYYAFVVGAFALHGANDAFKDPVLIADGATGPASPPSPSPTPALQALKDHHADQIMKAAVSSHGKALAAHLAKVLKG